MLERVYIEYACYPIHWNINQMCLNYKLIIEFAKCDNFILQFFLCFGENKKGRNVY